MSVCSTRQKPSNSNSSTFESILPALSVVVHCHCVRSQTCIPSSFSGSRYLCSHLHGEHLEALLTKI